MQFATTDVKIKCSHMLTWQHKTITETYGRVFEGFENHRLVLCINCKRTYVTANTSMTIDDGILLENFLSDHALDLLKKREVAAAREKLELDEIDEDEELEEPEKIEPPTPKRQKIKL